MLLLNMIEIKYYEIFKLNVMRLNVIVKYD